MKPMVLPPGGRRRLLRAAVVGGIGPVVRRPARRTGTHQVDEHRQEVRPDTDAPPRGEPVAAERGLRHG